MRLHRIYVDLSLSKGAEAVLPPRASTHISKVLRCRTGDSVILFNGDGHEYIATLLAGPHAEKRVRIDSFSGPEKVQALQIHLGLALSKGDRMDLGLQKSVELGVNRITPLFSQYSVVQLNEQRLKKRSEHWQSIVISASEQSGRSRLPQLMPAQGINQFLTENPSGLMLTPDAPLALTEARSPRGRITLVIGPEGGFSDDEKILAQRNQYQLVRIGPRILRTETAPVAAIAAIQTLWGDFRGE